MGINGAIDMYYTKVLLYLFHYISKQITYNDINKIFVIIHLLCLEMIREKNVTRMISLCYQFCATLLYLKISEALQTLTSPSYPVR
jgi:hypothetical protein